jgi:hemolysin-activating ACP:hemolysin acyltransferase
MKFIFDKSQLQDIHQIISLYKEFDKYKEYTREELYYHILPSIKLNQYKIIKENNNVVAFANWAYLDNNSEKEYKQTGDFSDESWKSGDNPWVIDVVSKINGAKMANWLRHFFKKFKWMRSNNNFKFYRISKKGF